MSGTSDPSVPGRARGHSALVRSAIQDRLTFHERNLLSSIGDGDECVVVRLAPNAALIAEELKREFGDEVSITVGFKPFPPGGVNFGPVLLEPSDQAGWWSSMRITCEIADSVVARGDSTTGQLVVLNHGGEMLRFLAGVSAGWLCVPGTLDVVGGYSGAISGGLRLIGLAPGETTSLSFIIGTASCQPDDEYVVESGAYDVAVPLSICEAGAPDPDRLLIRGCSVTVTDAESL